MANPLFNALGGNQGNGMLAAFSRFMQSMRGRDPDAMLNDMIRSGQVSQAQLNQAQQMAQQMRGIFEPYFKR